MAMEAGIPVRALVHRPVSCVRLARLGEVDMRICDIVNAASMEGHLEGVQTVFHCAYGLGGTATVASTVIDGTLNVLRAAVAQGVQRVVILSSIMALGDVPEVGVVTEETHGRTHTDIYGESKARMEEAALAFGREHSLEVAILQPSCVFGPFSGAFVTDHVNRMLRDEFYFIDGGRGRANLLYVDNLVDAMFAAAQSPKAVGRRFIVNEEEHDTTWHEYFSAILEALERPAPPSIDRGRLLALIGSAEQKRSVIRLIREAVRAHPDAGKRIAELPAFKLWRRLRGRRQPEQKPVPKATDGANPGQGGFTPSFLGNEAFVRLFASETVYSSESIRVELGWTPSVPRSVAMEATRHWAESTWRGTPL
jgi:nucleoside-diphosphate-sugar epimerase